MGARGADIGGLDDARRVVQQDAQRCGIAPVAGANDDAASTAGVAAAYFSRSRRDTDREAELGIDTCHRVRQIPRVSL